MKIIGSFRSKSDTSSWFILAGAATLACNPWQRVKAGRFCWLKLLNEPIRILYFRRQTKEAPSIQILVLLQKFRIDQSKVFIFMIFHRNFILTQISSVSNTARRKKSSNQTRSYIVSQVYYPFL